MRISKKVWNGYISALRKVNEKAGAEMKAFLDAHDWQISRDERKACIDFAYALSTKYGEAAGEIACQMYDKMAGTAVKTLPAAEPAATATYAETAKAINGTMKTGNVEVVAGAVSRLVKMAGVDTTMKNAIRDHAEWAWIPVGDTCAFCITLASRGWQPASRSQLKGNHAEHIHANCDCTFAIRFDGDTDVDGYDPEKYLKMYQEADPNGSSKDKINAMRRAFYAENKGSGVTDLGGSSAEDLISAKWTGDKISKSLKGDYSEFEDRVNESESKKLYAKYGEAPTYTKDRSGYYSPGGDAVHYELTKREGMHKFSTFAHETGHMFDRHIGRAKTLKWTEVDAINKKCIIGSGMRDTIRPLPSNSDEFLAALRSDMDALRPKLGDLKKDFLATAERRNASHGVQDTLDGFFSTQDKGIFPWGHGNRYYNRVYNKQFVAFGNEKNLKEVFSELGYDSSNLTKTKRLSRIYETASEAWANISSADVCGGIELDYIKKYMPKTYKAYINIIKEL